MLLKPGGGEVGGHIGATERCVGAGGPVGPGCGPNPDGMPPEFILNGRRLFQRGASVS